MRLAAAPLLLQVTSTAREAYQYAVSISKVVEPPEEGTSARPPRPPRKPASDGPLPARICRAAMVHLSVALSWPVGSWAFDGRANMYTVSAQLVPGNKLEKEVLVTLPDEPQEGHPHHRPLKLLVGLDMAAVIDMDMLGRFLR